METKRSPELLLKPTQILPQRFADLKRSLLPQDKESEERLIASWNKLLVNLKELNEEIKKNGSNVEFSDLKNLSPTDIENIKRRGSVVIRNVVDREQASSWKKELEDFVKVNPVEGVPEEDKQFFQLYWTKPQVQARSHPNVLQLGIWLNNLYRLKTGVLETNDDKSKGVDLSKPLIYADRFRIRHPGVQWNAHPPHIDGGGIERWEDPKFRSCYSDILNGNWERHDPYELMGRLDAKISLYGRPNQASVFRTFQGWLALSKTAPTQGTLEVFPDVLLSSAYLILRPFFRLKEGVKPENQLDSDSWELDASTSEFPGIFAREDGYFGPRLTPDSHPHLRLEENMIPVPSVQPGDMVFWHCDVVHSVEREHTGKEDSAVMYIPAVPLTPQNLEYIQRQKDSFLNGTVPPDFPKGAGEAGFVGVGRETDIIGDAARKAWGLAY